MEAIVIARSIDSKSSDLTKYVPDLKKHPANVMWTYFVIALPKKEIFQQ